MNRVAGIIIVLLGNLQNQCRGNLGVHEEWAVEYLMAGAMDAMQHTHIELWKLYIQRQALRGSAPYEVGFLVRTSEERYRKMVDLYNSSILMKEVLRTRDQILHLQKIEKLHWDVMHLANMLHEVERKYKINPQVLATRVFYAFGVTPNTTTVATTRKTKPTPQPPTRKPKPSKKPRPSRKPKTKPTTTDPNATTMEPKATTLDPNATTMDPKATTMDPNATTMEPKATTMDPKATTMDPNATTMEPKATTLDPKATTLDPNATTMDPKATTMDPNAPTMKPKATTMDPNATTMDST